MNKIEAAAVARVPAGTRKLSASVVQPPVAMATTWAAMTMETQVCLWAVTILGAGDADRPVSVRPNPDLTVRELVSARRAALLR